MSYAKIEKKIKQKERNLTQERNERCVPIAHDILKLIANTDGPLGDVTAQEFKDAYKPLVLQIMETYLAKDTIIHETDFIKRLMLQKVETISDMVAASINEGVERLLEQKLWKKPEKEVTFGDVDKLLRE